MNDKDAVTFAKVEGTDGVEGSVPGDATDGNEETDFSTTVEEG